MDCPGGEDEVACPHAQCTERQYECSPGHCISRHLRCDGKCHCTDCVDESKCPCKADDFRCAYDKRVCLAKHKRCDGIRNCQDNSDERDCAKSECHSGMFRCNNDRCISRRLVCDTRNDCGDGSDEASDICDDEPCAADQFECDDGTCLNIAQRCDNRRDCDDGSDEQHCDITHTPKCTDDQFECHNSQCIGKDKTCDSVEDCDDGSDEIGCDGDETATDEPPYEPCTEFTCGDGACIPHDFKCNGHEDCDDGSDEHDCPPRCEYNEFACEDRCIDFRQRCDGHRDCRRGEDEHGCPPPAAAEEEEDERPTTCGGDEHTCGDGSCVAAARRCDGRRDCRDASDEHNCCQPHEFRCGSGECIPSPERCDSRPNCADRSDEQGCPATRCRAGEWRCRNSRQCIPESGVCNGLTECADFTDEQDCEPPPARHSCPRGQFWCENGPCIDENLRCNGRIDCPYDRSDELDCSSRHPMPEAGLNLKTYPSDQIIKESREVVFQCRDEGAGRVPVRWARGNGLPLPAGSRDHNGRLEMPNIQVEHTGPYVCEAVGQPASMPGSRKTVHLTVEKYAPITAPPPKSCGYNEATCSNGDCIAKDSVCDGRYDCPDGSDETRCSPHGCEPNQFRCANKRCVLKSWRCDGDNDCGDHSDEMNCATNPPGSACKYEEFACASGNQCVPRSFHCDAQTDCIDSSDEIGCSAPLITHSPQPMTTLYVGDRFIINCTAVGVPVPEINWRLNWGHVPAKCTTTNHEGYGVLTCPDIQISDQGAYSCEAINSRGIKFAVPDNILTVKAGDEAVCPRGYFNDEARDPAECISCFCFGAATECVSANLYTFQIPPPFDSHKLIGVAVDGDNIEIRDEPIYRGAQPRLTSSDRYGVQAQLSYGEPVDRNVVPYYALPENYHGNQLKSYGGYLKYHVKFEGRGSPTSQPDVILSGNGYTLIHTGEPLDGRRDNSISIRFFAGSWEKVSRGDTRTVASRAEIMMALASVDNILIKMAYTDGPVLDTTIKNLKMDTAAVGNTGLGQAAFVEHCTCPVGYSGLSCEQCASGYVRHSSGPWLGKCHLAAPEPCPPGTYGDPRRGQECQVCPCPLTSPSNQFARTCSKRGNDVVCDCQPGYVGLRCERCEDGYTGNPMTPGDSCRPSRCNPDGSLHQTPDAFGNCVCKIGVTGPNCDQCKANSFHLSSENQFGCINCFCMGITKQCSSSNLYRTQIKTVFTSSRNEFSLVESLKKKDPITDGIRLDKSAREIVYDEFSRRRPDVYYWSLPARYLNDKVTAYGGDLTYTLRYVPVPGGLSSRNTAPDVELISNYNDIRLLYFSKSPPQPNTPQNITVPILEQYWQRSDGKAVDREHLLMTLADVEAILIKATYTTNTREASLISVSLDTANERNMGSLVRAHAVEQCVCPPEYRGLSCEDCAVGHTRSIEGLYLGLCEPCRCNGHSRECDPEDGVCKNCEDNTTGENCEECLPGYDGDAISGSCTAIGDPTDCQCDEAGSEDSSCEGGRCQCKSNVEGNRCDRCREGTFALSKTNPEGCTECYCLGVTDQCVNSNLWMEQIPIQIYDNSHGFTLTDMNHRNVINAGFILNVESNEIGYTYPENDNSRLYWSLPPIFTGNKVSTYGGALTFVVRYVTRGGGEIVEDKDVIITGNGITIYWVNKLGTPVEDERTTFSIRIATTGEWQRLEYRSAPRPASRDDVLAVLANIDSILIRASPSTNTHSSHISDIILDTAVDRYTGKEKAFLVEMCRCPEGYLGLSCETCAIGYYRDLHDRSSGPLGACKRCPCSGNEESCSQARDSNVVCKCLPGYVGDRCEREEGGPIITTTRRPIPPDNRPTIEVVVSEPILQIVDIGGEARFECHGRSLRTSRPVNVEWSKLNGELPAGRSYQDGRGILVITELTASDSGTYVCQARNQHFVVQDTATLTVGANNPRSPEVTLTPDYLDRVEGESAEIKCEATGNPAPVLQWTRIDGTLNPQHEFRNGVFRIPYLATSDEGTYRCTAVNSVGRSEMETVIYVQKSSTSPPAENIVPTIEPTEVRETEGRTFTLTCRAPRKRNSNMRWEKQPGELSASARADEGVLTVYDATLEDSGVYTCVVTSDEGIGTAVARVIIETTHSQPSARVSPDRQTVGQGQTVEFRCTASGEPKPSIRWTRRDDEFGGGVQQHGELLRIVNVQPSDRGMYVCVAQNSRGTSQATAMLDIERRASPEIQIDPQSTLDIPLGESASLQCQILAGIPTPTVRWRRVDGRPLSRNVDLRSEDYIRFNHVTAAESGEYECEAENSVGRTTATAVIRVSEPPVVTIFPNSRTVTVYEGDALHLECRATGSPSPTVAWSPHRESGLRGLSGSSEVFGRQPPQAQIDIDRVIEDDAGEYTCTARNTAGTTKEYVTVIVRSRDSSPTRGDIPGGEVGLDNEIEPNAPSTVNQYRVPLGGLATLTCRTESYTDPINLNWVRSDNRPLPPYSVNGNGVLRIDPTLKSAEGDYNCYGRSPSGATLFTTRARLIVIERPHIKLQPEVQEVRPGDDAVIVCTATGDQPIDVSWSAIDRDLPASAYPRGGELLFRSIKVSDAGKYRCSARNSAGNAFSVGEVRVKETATRTPIRAEAREVRVSFGKTVMVRCIVNPVSGERHTITWSREGVSSLPHNARADNDELTLRNVREQDSGKYICTVNTPSGQWSDHTNVIVSRRPTASGPPSVLRIRPSKQVVQSRDTFDLVCGGAPRGAAITWRKDGGELPSNVQTSGTLLRITDVRSDNVGEYSCEARDERGDVHEAGFRLRLEPHRPEEEVPTEIDDEPTVTKADRGSTIMLNCKTDLERPIEYEWVKENGVLQNGSETHEAGLLISNVVGADAGTYVCIAKNDQTTIRIPMVLVVTGIVPYFAQAPLSYLAFKQIPDAYLSFTLEISFKPETLTGLILYNGHQRKSPDYVSVSLVDGVPVFQFNCGSSSAVIRSDRPVELGKWHTVKISRQRRQGRMYVDNYGPFLGTSAGKHQGLDLVPPLYIGGHPDYSEMAPNSGPKVGFVGCISRLVIKRVEHDLIGEAHTNTGVTTCETCEMNTCRNRGVCQEAATAEGYQCICPHGYSGLTCEHTGEFCYPGVCGTGKCVNTHDGIECRCPMHKVGARCERDHTIAEPAFQDDAYVAYPTPKPNRRLKMALRFNPATLRDGIILYCGESDDGAGQFTSLAIKDRHLEFKMDTGAGPVVVRSDHALKPDEWITVSANKIGNEVKLVVNGDSPRSAQIGGPKLNLQTPLYVGGYDKERIVLNQHVGVNNGFEGCISGIEISGVDLNVITSAIGSSNVQDCSDLHRNHESNHIADNSSYATGHDDSYVRPTPISPCSHNPCKNDGTCYPSSPTDYSCACVDGYSGRHCEEAPMLCDSLRPCQNGGTCTGNKVFYKCNCPLRYTGTNCSEQALINTEASFSGDGFIELDGNLLNVEEDNRQQIAVAFSTNSSDGVIFWHGQGPDVDGKKHDYQALAVVGGYLEFHTNIGSTETATILDYNFFPVNDGQRHNVIIKREGNIVKMEVDKRMDAFSESDPAKKMLTCDGSIYLGGTPNLPLMSGKLFSQGFTGCIHQIEFQNNSPVDLGADAISGVNVKACVSFNDSMDGEDQDEDEDDDDDGENLVN